jgi:hypothetical protein
MNILRLSHVVLAAIVLTAAIPAHAAVAMAATHVVNGNPQLGKPLDDRDCADCRTQHVSGDGAKIYFRNERRASAPDQLLAQVSYCSPEIGAIYFPDEEEHVAAYLNKQYYRFK